MTTKKPAPRLRANQEIAKLLTEALRSARLERFAGDEQAAEQLRPYLWAWVSLQLETALRKMGAPVPEQRLRYGRPLSDAKPSPAPDAPVMVGCEECEGTGRTEAACVNCNATLVQADVDANPEADACRARVALDDANGP